MGCPYGDGTRRVSGRRWGWTGRPTPPHIQLVNSLDDLRSRYGRLADDDLQALVAIDSDHLTPEARQALAEEVLRRGLATRPTFAPTDPTAIPRSPTTGEWLYPKARLGARLLAYIIDITIGIMLPLFAALIPFVIGRARLNVVNVMLLASSIVWAIYYTFTKDAHDEGRSIGKRATGLMVVNVKKNTPCSIGESVMRALVLGVVNAIPAVGWAIEPLVVLVSDNGRRAGDLAAGTQVIEAAAYQRSTNERAP